MFLEELHGGHEEVEQQTPLGGVEIVQEGDDCWVIKTFVAQVLSHDGPVFFFDVRIIVFVIFAGTRVLDRVYTLREVFQQWPVDKL